MQNRSADSHLHFLLLQRNYLTTPAPPEPSGIQVLSRKYELSYQVFGIFMFLLRRIKKSMIAERARVTGKYVEK